MFFCILFQVSLKKQQNDLINELNQRNIVSPQDIQDGQFENIILGIKSEPYRTTHVVVNGEINKRSFRRQKSSSNSAKLTNESEPL